MLPESIILGILLVTLLAAVALALALGGTPQPRRGPSFRAPSSPAPSSEGASR